MNAIEIAIDLLEQQMEPAEVALLLDLKVESVVAIGDAMRARPGGFRITRAPREAGHVQ